MFFVGIPQVDLPLGLQTVYDIPIAAIALVLIYLYVAGSIQDAVKLAKQGE